MIIGHQKQIQFLEKSIELGKLSHAYLFSGQNKIGKKTVAFHFAEKILKQDIQNNLHPDFTFVSPKESEIKIDEIRELSWKLSLKPGISDFKVAVIDGAHGMNSEAQNCFLKTLEEPRGNSVIILISEYPNLLLPTIRSRTEEIRFHPVQKEDIEKYLKTINLPSEKIQEITSVSVGKPGVALDFISNPEKLKEKHDRVSQLVDILNYPLYKRFKYAKLLSENSNLKEIFDIWQNFFRELLLDKIYNRQPDSVFYRNSKNIPSLEIDKIKQIISQIQKIDYLLASTNVNARLALEVLLMDF